MMHIDPVYLLNKECNQQELPATIDSSQHLHGSHHCQWLVLRKLLMKRRKQLH